MLMALFNGPYGTRIINSGISIVAIALCIILAYWLFKHKFDSKRQQHQFRSRMMYLGVLIFLMVMIRIWIEGFTHIFTMLSLVAAGLVVTNKETIMNLAGWLIINWRGVFSEGDCIQIQNMTGIIADIRLFHFKLYETTSLACGKATGKIIKVPNSLILTSGFTLFTGDENINLNEVTFTFKTDDDIIKKAKLAEKTITQLLDAQYKESLTFNTKSIRKKNAMLGSLINLTPEVTIKPTSDKENTVSLKVSYYAYAKDAKHIEDALSKKLLSKARVTT